MLDSIAKIGDYITVHTTGGAFEGYLTKFTSDGALLRKRYEDTGTWVIFGKTVVGITVSMDRYVPSDPEQTTLDYDHVGLKDSHITPLREDDVWPANV